MALRRLSPLASGDEPCRVLAPLAGVALAAEPVHGDGQRLVRLAADRAVRHRAGGEPLDDRLDWLDLLDGDRSAPVELEVEEAAERAEPLVLLVDRLRVLLEDVEPPRPGRVLEPVDGLGVEQVELPLAAPLILAPLLEGPGPDLAGGIGAGVVRQGLAGDLLQADAADARGGLVEVAGDELLVQADRLEDLGAAVALDRADAHLGHHLDDPLLDRLAVLLDRLGVVDAPA
jgi:hypothetical protein